MYQSAPPRQRREVHRALAAVTDEGRDPDRRAWHLAAPPAGPDEEVASELERSAPRAQARGGLAAAAALHQRSALTRDPARRADRALAAAQANLQAGAFDAALELLAAAETGALDDFQRARIDLLRRQIAFASGLGAAAPLLLRAAKQQLITEGRVAAASTLRQAAHVFASDHVSIEDGLRWGRRGGGLRADRRHAWAGRGRGAGRRGDRGPMGERGAL